MMDCLTEIVGVSQSDCDCILTGLTEDQIDDLRLSTSGLYLDDLPGGIHLKALKDADACRSMATMAQTAIKNATLSLENDLIVALNNKYTKSKKNFVGDIGRMSYAQTLAISKNWQGIRIRPWDYSDAVLTVNRLSIITNSATPFNLLLHRVPVDSVMGELLTYWSIAAPVANGWTTVTLNPVLRLPMNYNDEQVEYWFVYDTGGTFAPKDNKIECSTCDKASGKLGEFVSAQGVQFDNVNALNLAVTDSYAHGLSLSVSIKCDNEKLFCREYLEDDAVGVTMANAVWFRAGELLIEDVLKQPDVNRYTTMAREYLWGKRNHFRKEYETRVLYLAEVIDVEASNCYVCRQSANMPMVHTIFK